MKRDVGIACQKVHEQGRIKVMVNIQSLIHPTSFHKRAKMEELGFVYLPSLLSLFVYFLAHHSYISSFLRFFFLAGLDGLLQLANMVAGFSPMLLLLTVSAGSYSDQVSDKHICHPQQKV